MIYGYARVSTEGQELTAQREALAAAGCARTFAEKVSGAKADRPQLARLLAGLAPGDVIIVTRLDRLARSTRDLLTIVDTIAKAEAHFRSLAEPWADTTSPTGRLLLTMFGGIAEFERHLINERTAEGRRQARRKGKHMGRPPRLTPEARAAVRQRLEAGEAGKALAREYGIHHSNIYRLRQRDP